MDSGKRILIISEAHLIKTFVQTAIDRIKEEGARFDCFITTPVDQETRLALAAVFENVFINEYPKGIVKKLPKLRTVQAIYGMRKMARKIGEYDIVHIHFHYYYYAFFTPIIRKKARLFFLTYFGSDFFRINNVQHLLAKRTINLLDGVFAENEVMLDSVVKKYDILNKKIETGTLIFLMENFISFETFLKNNTPDSARKIWQVKNRAIVGGYNAAGIMRHKMMIDALNTLKAKLPGYKVIFPMTYGWRGHELRAMVKEELKSSAFDAEVVEDFLSVEKLQALRLAADIFINITASDQMAASMLEHLAAGSVVVTGKWLPYSGLVKRGVYFISMESPLDLAQVLSEVLDNLEFHKEKSKVNRAIILNMMSWDSIKINWYKHYKLNQN